MPKMKELKKRGEFFVIQRQKGLENSVTRFYFEGERLFFEMPLFLNKPIEVLESNIFIRNLNKAANQKRYGNRTISVKVKTNINIGFDFVNPKILDL